MDQRAIVSVDIQKDGHVFSFHMPLGAKWSAAYDAAIELIKQMEEHLKALEEQSKQATPEAPEVVDKAAQ